MAGIFQRARELSFEQGKALAEGVEGEVAQGLALVENIERDIAESVVQAYERGLHRGESFGKEDGMRTLLFRLLWRRFGPPRVETVERVYRASKTELEAWGENTLDADALEDVFKTAE